MGTTLAENTTWGSVKIPIPGEPVRVGGGTGLAITIEGTNGDANGGVTYTAVVTGARVRHLGGVSKTLGTTLNGNDVTVQLGTDGAGNVTSSANQVKANVDGVAGAILSTAVTGTGAALAGIFEAWVALAAGVQGSIRPAVQSLTDRTKYLYEMSGTHQPPRLFASMDGATLVIEGLAGFGAKSLYGSATYNPGAMTLADTWYYVYRSASGFSHSTTPPDAALVSPNDNTKRYVGCFKSGNAGQIVDFTAQHGVYEYHYHGAGVAANLAFTTWTAQSLAFRVPPTSRIARLLLGLRSQTGSRSYYLRPKGTVLAEGRKYDQAMGAALGIREVYQALSSDQSFEYKVTGGVAGSDDFDVTVLGFTER